MHVTQIIFLYSGFILNSIFAQELPVENAKINSASEKLKFGEWLLTGSTLNQVHKYRYKNVEYEGYDGWYNNFARPDSGAIDKPLLRRSAAAYEDGTYKPFNTNRPNPLEVSKQILKGPIGSKSRTGKNALLVFFGQQVVEEILDAQRPACPPEYFNIEIPKDHIFHTVKPKHTVLPFLRTRYDQRTGYNPNNPRQQLNEITPYLDGGLMYGISKQWADELRTYTNRSIDENGRLASTNEGRFPDINTHRLPMANPPPPFYHSKLVEQHELFPVSRFFKLGNPRGNENTFLLTFGVLWFRWHNYLADTIKRLEPDWSSEKIFNEARKWVIASQQHIVTDEWLPTWLNRNLPVYGKYNPSIDPQIDQFFQTAAFRFGHTLVPPGVYIRDYVRRNCTTAFKNWMQNTVRTCNSFWRPQEALLTKSNDDKEIIDIDRILMGMSVQLCEEEDHKIVEDLRENVFGPLEFPRRDLMAVNIQRGRDHGIPDYNTVRKIMNLRPLNNFTEFEILFGVSNDIVNKLSNLYKDINMVDLWVGGILETGDGPGELFQTIILDQFRRIRDGDRFWYENKDNNLFTKYEINRIKQLSIYDIIMVVTQMDGNDIPLSPFQVPKTVNEVNCPNLILSYCGFKGQNKTNCYHLPQLNSTLLKETCVLGNSYDYFSNSEYSYIFSFIAIGTFIVGTVGLVFVLRVWKAKENLKLHLTNEKKIRHSFRNKSQPEAPIFSACEWLGKSTQPRPIVILFSGGKKIEIQSQLGNKLRVLDLNYNNSELNIYPISNDCYILLRNKNHYDLMLKFESEYLREIFQVKLTTFLKQNDIKENLNSSWTIKMALKEAVTKEKRQHRLEMFFRVVFAQAFHIEHSQTEILKLDATTAKEIANMELTLNEFAEVLNMRPDSEFVVKMFQLIDKNRSSFISFREFVDLLVIFANGNADQKLKLLFDMYDINAIGYLTQDDFISMIRSFLETVGGKIDNSILQETLNTMMQSAGLRKKEKLYFEDFKKIVGNDVDKLDKARLGFKGLADNSYLNKAKDAIENIYASASEIRERIKGDVRMREMQASNESAFKQQNMEEKKMHNAFINYIERKSIHLFWYILYTLVVLAIFAERAYYYSVEREHTGLRRIAGYGVTITRGAASAMMFTYSSLLVTMCRNTFTILRETFLSKYVPFDSMVDYHKYIAYCALVFTLIHIVGHAFNFYHISTQTADDLTCLFRNYFHSTHELPKFHYWCWQTITGFTGVILTLLMALIYIFAQTPVRRSLYNWFWHIHSLYPVFFIFLVMHGAGRLVQDPFFYYFFLGPLILFAVDKLICISRKKVIIPVLNAVILPSDVTMLECRRPDNFEYKSGQWVRIACIDLNSNEYHPFTLTSSPDEKTLMLHIRAVGPWTRNIRKLYDNTILLDRPLPVIYLDGPYGEGHQNWNKHEVTVLVGGGIGVTPFASILKDIVFKVNTNKVLQTKKVYFIWISRTQKQFEWLVDILRNVQENDHSGVVTSHIYITQFYEKFDIRTILLYICERHYQKISNRSLFTNLEAVTHFGRPKFKSFFSTLQTIHSNCGSIGVFSCGPPSMTNAIESACADLNKESTPYFEHSYKNF